MDLNFYLEVKGEQAEFVADFLGIECEEPQEVLICGDEAIVIEEGKHYAVEVEKDLQIIEEALNNESNVRTSKTKNKA